MVDYINSYKEYLLKELNYSLNTINSYERDILKFNNFLNDVYFKDVNKNIIRQYLKYLDDLSLSNKTISRNLSSLRMFYNFLEELGVIKNNYFNLISNPKINKPLPKYLSNIEIETLLESFDKSNMYDLRNLLIVELIYSTGMRLNEISNIKLNDINFSNNSIKVLGKGNVERVVYFGKYAEEYIHLYLNESRKRLLNKKNSDYLFVSRLGNKLSDSSINKIVSSSAKKIGLLMNVSPHTLRHTFATHLLNEGADIKTVQTLLGHKNINTTEVYTHVSNKEIKEVYLKTHPRR